MAAFSSVLQQLRLRKRMRCCHAMEPYTCAARTVVVMVCSQNLWRWWLGDCVDYKLQFINFSYVKGIVVILCCCWTGDVDMRHEPMTVP